MATVDDLLALDVRVGTVVSAARVAGARTPTHALHVELAGLGVKVACAEISDLYEPDELVGIQVVAVVNVPPRRVAGLVAEVVVLAVDDGRGRKVLLMPERPVPDGGKVS